VIGSPHVHQIVGGNFFNAIIESVTYDLPSGSNCTSYTFSESFSNFWTAALHYLARNKTFKWLEQFPNDGLARNGGITVYYISQYDGVSSVTALKPVSFHLFSLYLGNPGVRKKSRPLALQNSNFVSLHYGRAESVANHILRVSTC
jgi:hypothetical protein